MLRPLLTLTVVLCCLIAAAQDTRIESPAFEEGVPVYHWSYLALDLLQREGILVDYPSGYFKRNEEITRLEFAITIIGMMRRLSKNSNKCQEHDVILIKALCTEYYPEIAEASELVWWPDNPLKSPE